ncbi:hypothetical protein [Streptomyces cucumeris]|uniref:hypothetical protein n=1 Tax=Streptomyces cucumeris TaxID=2962890 RepID=UPI003EBBB7D8
MNKKKSLAALPLVCASSVAALSAFDESEGSGRSELMKRPCFKSTVEYDGLRYTGVPNATFKIGRKLS